MSNAWCTTSPPPLYNSKPLILPFVFTTPRCTKGQPPYYQRARHVSRRSTPTVVVPDRLPCVLYYCCVRACTYVRNVNPLLAQKKNHDLNRKTYYDTVASNKHTKNKKDNNLNIYQVLRASLRRKKHWKRLVYHKPATTRPDCPTTWLRATHREPENQSTPRQSKVMQRQGQKTKTKK